MKPANKVCHICSRPMAKAAAVQGGIAYCGACHKRLSTAMPCRSCGKTVKVHEGIEPICKTCQAAGRSCLRCGKPVPRAGLTLPEGVVCRCCARYFKKPEPCAICGEPSVHLARDSRLGFDQPACPKCRRRYHTTCACCGKHRPPAGSDSQGRSICKDCVALDGAPYICPKCGKPGRRHSAEHCDECYWTGRLELAVKELANGLTSPRLRAVLAGYPRYLADRCGAKKAFLELDRRWQFFIALDREPRLLADHGALLERFGAEGLRRFTVPYGFLAAVGVISPVGETLVSEVTEKRRQREILSVSRDSWQPWAKRALTDFNTYLTLLRDRYWQRGWRDKRARFVDRTVTSCLRNAAQFLEEVKDLSGTHEIDQERLLKYVAEHPGRRNSLRRFISFINSRGRFDGALQIPSVNCGIRRGSFVSVNKEKQIMLEISDDDAGTCQARLIKAVMLLFAQHPRRVVRLTLRDISGEPGARAVRFARIAVPLPPELSDLLERYLVLRQSVFHEPGSRYLFPGRLPGSHLSVAAVSYMLGKQQITSAQLFASSMIKSYLFGVRHPATLVLGYGICAGTAMKYFDTVTSRLRNELNDRVGKRRN